MIANPTVTNGGAAWRWDRKRGMPMLMRKLIQDESGATAIEYGLIAALIAVAAITAMASLGNELSGTFSTVDSTLETANDAAN
jgi:pilus assembly protein Flp/PilA